jgi:hypothetical protein
MAVMIPTLTPKGFVTAVADKADAAILNFYVSLYSQTNMYRGANKPLAYLVQQHGESALGMEQALTSELTTYLSRLFDSVSVDVKATTVANGINLRLDVMVRDDGQTYSFGHQLLTTNSKIIDIVDVVNTGSLIRKNPVLFKA